MDPEILPSNFNQVATSISQLSWMMRDLRLALTVTVALRISATYQPRSQMDQRMKCTLSPAFHGMGTCLFTAATRTHKFVHGVDVANVQLVDQMPPLLVKTVKRTRLGKMMVHVLRVVTLIKSWCC